MAIPWYIVKHYCQKHSKFAVSTLTLLVLTLVFYRYILFFSLAWSFVLGVVVSHSYLSADFLLPNVLFMFSRPKKKGVGTDDELTLMKTFCTVCGQRKCPRHRPELNILAFQPWTNLEIRKSVDQAIDEFLNIVLNEFVYSWYKNLSTDEEFVDEIRVTLRFFAAVILRRAKKIDVPTLVMEKFIRAGLQHLHSYLKAQQSGATDLQKATLEQLGPCLHYAMHSRKSELEYLRRLVEMLFPYILRPQALQSKTMCALAREILAGSVLMPAMDAVANPDMVNNMILIFLDDTPPPKPTEPPSPLVSFLGGSFSKLSYRSFSDPEQQLREPKLSKSSLRLVLGDVMDPERPTNLYPFMNFLKSEAAVNVLQFALSCEDFNKKILDPDLSELDQVSLHNMVKDLYKNYCAPTAPDKIKFEENIVNELREIVEGPPEGVVRLRTSTPMFRAYEHVYNLLNHTFLPLFHQSEDYYTMICGERVASQLMNRQSSSFLVVPKPINSASLRPGKKKEFGIATIGSKLKEVFKPSDVRPSSPFPPDMEDGKDPDTVTIASSSSLDDELQEEELEGTFQQFQPPDLSTWRVTIPRVGARPDPENPKRRFFVFIIDVRRVDVTNDGNTMWTVPRRYNEFYVLEQKLTEFHGEFLDCVLPPKKMIGTKNEDFIDGKREFFEQYLQKLLTKPKLKGSQLLYNFLTCETDFNTGFDINIGKMLKSVPMKLVKQKGQHLESFLSSFAASTEVPKPRPSKQERRDSGASFVSTSSEKLCISMFENNAEGLVRVEDAPGDLLSESSEIDSIFDTLIYIARYVYRAPDWVHHVMMTARMFVKNSLESFLDWYLDKKVEQILQEHRLVGLVHLLRDVLFYDNDPPRTDEQKRERYRETLAGALDFIPKPFVYAVGPENHEYGTKLLLDALQHPKLNKQLTYVLLDIAITELFPELRH